MKPPTYADDGRTALPLDARWHGTTGGYSNHRCRCDACRAAWTTFHTAYRHRNAQKPTPDHVHGTSNGYTNYECRCPACTSAYTLQCRKYRNRRTSSSS